MGIGTDAPRERDQEAGPPDHDQQTAAARAQYGRQAAAYTTSASHAGGADLARIRGLLAPRGDELLLDVATGTGHTALAMALHCRLVIGLDPTPEMLREARALAERRGVANLALVLGAAERLPFPDGWFDAVTVRRAPHHFASIPAALTEMRRVLRPGGRLGLVDQITPDDPAGSALLESLERRRDPSHNRALSVAGWRAALAAAGFAVAHLEVDEEQRDLAGYLQIAGVQGEDRAAVLAILQGADDAARAAIGYRAEPAPDGSFLKQRIVIMATRG